MLLTSSDGASVELRLTRDEFPLMPAGRGDEDENWLVIHGRVRTASGEAWTFDDPCLTTDEARAIGDWFRAAAEGLVPVVEGPTEDSQELLAFLEPNLGSSVAARTGDSLVVRVHLSLEAVAGRPEAGEDELHDHDACAVPLHVRREELLAAARAWEEDNRPFPRRSARA